MFWFRGDEVWETPLHRSVYELSDEWAEGQPAWSFGDYSGAGWYFEPFNGDSAWAEDDYYDMLFGTMGGTLTVGQWYHLAYVKNGTSHVLYKDGEVIVSGTFTMPANSSGWATGYEYLGAWPGVTYQGGHSFAEFREWTATLSQAEVQAEMASRTLVKSADVFRAVQLANLDGTDVSGQGHHLAVVNPTGIAAVTGPRGSRSASPSVSPSLSPSVSESTSPSVSPSESPSVSESTSPSVSPSASPSEGS